MKQQLLMTLLPSVGDYRRRYLIYVHRYDFIALVLMAKVAFAKSLCLNCVHIGSELPGRDG